MYSNFYLPDQVQASQKLLTIGMDLQLESNGTRFGMIKQKLFQLGSHFNLQDLNGNVMCYAQSRFTALGTQFDVFDAQNNRIGTIQEQIIKSLLTFGNIYRIYDYAGNVVGGTREREMVKTHVQVFNNMNMQECKMEKTHIFKDRWTIQFFDNTIDRRLLIFFPAFISMNQENRKHNY